MKALRDAAPQLAGKVSIEKQEWQGDVLHFAFTAEGKHIEGTLAVGDRDFDIYAKLPLVWRLFEGRIEKAVKEQVAAMTG